jgi:hypothetical protein
MPMKENRRRALELFKPAAVDVRADEDPVMSNIAKQRAARLARDANGDPRPESNPDARVAKRR